VTSWDVFSCVGGHAIGLEAAGIDTTWFCELNAWRRRVLAHHFPNVPTHDDIHTFEPDGDTDLLIGGPPCQKTAGIAAVHGKRTGESLWPAMRRLAPRAAWVVVEQPASAGHAWQAAVASDLARDGFYARRVDLTAFGLGGPCIRRRMFTLAHRDLSRLEIARLAVAREVERIAGGATDGNPWRAGVPRTLRVASGLPSGMDRRRRIEALGDSNPPVMAMVIGRAIMRANIDEPARQV
jgi:DNA (cytosine-5)-methyltransferase 1